jgi:hypothetical protein
VRASGDCGVCSRYNLVSVLQAGKHARNATTAGHAQLYTV